MSQRRRFYEALSLLTSSEDWGGLEFVEQQFDRVYTRVLAAKMAEYQCNGLPGGLASFLEHTGTAIMVISPDGIVLNVGAKMQRWLGRPYGQIIGKSLWDLFAPADALRRTLQVRETADSGTVTQIAYSAGRVGPVETMLVPIMNGGGKCSCVLALSRPIEGRRKFEAAFQSEEVRLIE